MHYLSFYRLCLGSFCLVLAGCASRSLEQVVVRGSDTEVNLVLHLAEAYMDQTPQVSIAVTGGGSGTGIASLINRKTDIANSSRPLLRAEEELALNRGIDVRPLVFAMDALAFVVHPDMPLESISLPQVRALYTGAIRNWQELGGPDLSVSLYGRQSNSGTYIYVRNELLKADYTDRVKQMNGSSQIVEGIRKDRSGIGYVGLGYVLGEAGTPMPGIKILSIREEEGQPAISPLDRAAILDGTYPVIRPLFQYIDGQPKGALRDFLEFGLSDVGQGIVALNGYFPVVAAYHRMNLQQLNDE
jgi:phosphate transport system substrate-binding protein